MCHEVMFSGLENVALCFQTIGYSAAIWAGPPCDVLIFQSLRFWRRLHVSLCLVDDATLSQSTAASSAVWYPLVRTRTSQFVSQELGIYVFLLSAVIAADKTEGRNFFPANRKAREGKPVRTPRQYPVPVLLHPPHPAFSPLHAIRTSKIPTKARKSLLPYLVEPNVLSGPDRKSVV